MGLVAPVNSVAPCPTPNLTSSLQISTSSVCLWRQCCTQPWHLTAPEGEDQLWADDKGRLDIVISQSRSVVGRVEHIIDIIAELLELLVEGENDVMPV